MFKLFSWRLWVLPSILLLISACAQQPGAERSYIEPVQSPNDSRDYRYLRLDNQMQVLLISDAKSEKAAASLDIYVGSAQNPEDRAGLAHFLEHMLFLGTDKYPDPAEYEQFVTEHGGSRNAYTAFEHTNYFFDVDQEHLEPALDRFAQFFVAPRFDEAYVTREVNAVEAEYQMGIKTDGRRTFDVVREIANPDHPFHVLGVGTSETLASTEERAVRDDLLEFYDKYYSSNLMSLVVLGRESLDELQTMVTGMFAAVPNRQTEIPDITAPLYKPETLPGFLQIEPEASERQLQLSFPMPDYRKDYDKKSMGYLANLIGHEGTGSLLSVLKSEGWAEGLGAGSGLAWRGGSAFSISVTLTESGLENKDEVLSKVFEYLEMLRREGASRELYEEQAQLAEQQFRFRESTQPVRYVSSLSSSMHYYPPEEILRGAYLMRDFDAAEIDEALTEYLTPENALVLLISKGVNTDATSEYYFTPYQLSSVADDALWMRDPGSDLDARLHLPAPNRFIADSVDLQPRLEAESSHPELVADKPNLRVWFQQDQEYEVPRGAMYLSFRNSQASSSPEQVALGELYVALLSDAVTEITYPAQLAGLQFSFYRHTKGITLKINGYDDKQMVLLNEIIDQMGSVEFSAERFSNIRADLVRNLENFKTTRPFGQVMSRARQLMNHGEYSETELIAALNAVELSQVEDYAADFWMDVQADVLINGNYVPSIVAALEKSLAGLLSNPQPTPLDELQVAKLAPGQSYVYPVDVPHEDSVVFHYVQVPGNDWQSRAEAALTGQAFKSGFFQELRTDRQFGYVVSAFYWPLLDVPGMGFLIQAPGNDAVEVSTAIDEFFVRSLGEDGITEEQFLRHRKALIGEILEPQKNLWEQSEYYWREISKGRFDFDSRQQFSDAVAEVEYEQWLTAARKLLLDQPAEVRVIAPGRWGLTPDGEKVSDVEEFQSGHPSYAIP